MCLFFFFKHKTAYEMRISDWSSDVCSSDLRSWNGGLGRGSAGRARGWWRAARVPRRRRRGGPSPHVRPRTWPTRGRSEERRVGQSVSVRVDFGGRRLIKKKKQTTQLSATIAH